MIAKFTLAQSIFEIKSLCNSEQHLNLKSFYEEILQYPVTILSFTQTRLKFSVDYSFYIENPYFIKRLCSANKTAVCKISRVYLLDIVHNATISWEQAKQLREELENINDIQDIHLSDDDLSITTTLTFSNFDSVYAILKSYSLV